MFIKKLTSRNIKKLVDHMVSLQGEDRRLRFGGMVNDEYIISYVEKSFIDGNSQWFGFEDNGIIVSACHASIINNEAELGCSVNIEYRGQGLAQQMFDRAVTWLRTKGVTEVFMHCLTENQIMKHIARKNDMTIVSEQGEVDATVEIKPATAATAIKDAYLDRMALYDMIIKTNYNAFDFYWKRNRT